MRQIRIRKQPQRSTVEPDLRTPSGRVLPY